MKIGAEEFEQVLALFQASDFDEMVVEVGAQRIHVRRDGTTETAVAPLPPTPAPTGPETDRDAAPAPVPDMAPAPPAALSDGLDGAIPVHADVSGVFYRSPSPAEPPFVEEGARVEAGASLGLIEVMKLFTSVVAPRSGEVARIAVANAAPVQKGDVLLYLRPAGEAS